MQLQLPILHEHLLAPLGLVFGKVQPHGNDAVEFIGPGLVGAVLDQLGFPLFEPTSISCELDPSTTRPLHKCCGCAG